MGIGASVSATVPKNPPTELQMEERPFAHGGFGEVYKAKWRHRNVVVKVIKTLDDEDKDYVMREANLTIGLSHPNVIDLFKITQLNDWKVGIVMEEAKHGSLDQWIGKIDQGQLSKIALDIIDGLKYVHSYKIIHRDIKPKNILMFGTKDEIIPKIADFGLAKIVQRTTKNSRVGDYIYMAPEVALHCQYGFPADIFSLAATLFEMFNEQLIVHAPEEVKRFMHGVHGGKVAKIPPSCKVPVYLINVIERGLNSNPDERPTLDEYYATLMSFTYGYFSFYLHSTK